MTNYAETAAQIEVRVAGKRIAVTSFDSETGYDMERNYGSGSPLPDTLSFKKIEHDGEITLKGNKTTLNNVLLYQPGESDIPEGFAPGTPRPFQIVVLHMDGTESVWQECFITSRGYQFSEGETAETRYSFFSMRKPEDPK